MGIDIEINCFLPNMEHMKNHFTSKQYYIYSFLDIPSRAIILYNTYIRRWIVTHFLYCCSVRHWLLAQSLSIYMGFSFCVLYTRQVRQVRQIELSGLDMLVCCIILYNKACCYIYIDTQHKGTHMKVGEIYLLVSQKHCENVSVYNVFCVCCSKGQAIHKIRPPLSFHSPYNHTQKVKVVYVERKDIYAIKKAVRVCLYICLYIYGFVLLVYFAFT